MPGPARERLFTLGALRKLCERALKNTNAFTIPQLSAHTIG
jgi:hypothetical protein